MDVQLVILHQRDNSLLLFSVGMVSVFSKHVMGNLIFNQVMQCEVGVLTHKSFKHADLWLSK